MARESTATRLTRHFLQIHLVLLPSFCWQQAPFRWDCLATVHHPPVPVARPCLCFPPTLPRVPLALVSPSSASTAAMQALHIALPVSLAPFSVFSATVIMRCLLAYACLFPAVLFVSPGRRLRIATSTLVLLFLAPKAAPPSAVLASPCCSSSFLLPNFFPAPAPFSLPWPAETAAISLTALVAAKLRFETNN